MNISYLRPEDWQKLSNKYFSAYAMLVSMSLHREKEFLQRELECNPIPGRKRWIEARLKELNELNVK